jgi:phosphoribosylanthranilate isomerase
MRPDISLCRKIIGLSSKPVIIAGGINAENVAAIIRQTGARCIDVMTGVERRPGVKDKNLLIRLLEASRRPFLLVAGFPFYVERRNLQI